MVSQSPFQIVQLGTTEPQRLKLLRLEALKDSPSAFITTFEEAVAWPDSNWQEQLRRLTTFVAVNEATDVGMVRALSDGQAAWLLSMWVSPAARRLGIGSALVRQVADWAKATGARRLLLDVVDVNVSAISTYLRLGFEPNGVVDPLPAPRVHLTERQFQLLL